MHSIDVYPRQASIWLDCQFIYFVKQNGKGKQFIQLWE